MPETTKFDTWAPKFMRLLMQDFQLTVEDAAAIIGNAGHESAGFDQLQELAPVVKGSRGGWGIMQWTGPRRRAAESYWGRNGYDPKDMLANYKWLWMELSGHDGTNEKRVIPKLKEAASLEKKVEVFCYTFLRPGVLHMNNRKAWARKALHAYYASDWKEELPVAKPEESATLPPVATGDKAMLSGYKTYIVAAMMGLIAVVEGLLGIDIPGAEMQGDWLTVLMAALGLGALRASK